MHAAFTRSAAITSTWAGMADGEVRGAGCQEDIGCSSGCVGQEKGGEVCTTEEAPSASSLSAPSMHAHPKLDRSPVPPDMSWAPFKGRLLPAPSRDQVGQLHPHHTRGVIIVTV